MSRHDRSKDMYEPNTYQLKRRIVELEERVAELEGMLPDRISKAFEKIFGGNE